MPLRRLLARKGLHPLTERCVNSQQNCHPWEQPVADSSRHHFPPFNDAPRSTSAAVGKTMRPAKYPRCCGTSVFRKRPYLVERTAVLCPVADSDRDNDPAERSPLNQVSNCVCGIFKRERLGDNGHDSS